MLNKEIELKKKVIASVPFCAVWVSLLKKKKWMEGAYELGLLNQIRDN